MVRSVVRDARWSYNEIRKFPESSSKCNLVGLDRTKKFEMFTKEALPFRQMIGSTFVF